jgi:glycosidase
LARLRERLRARGLGLMLDFVPNHTALDHPWVEHHPEYYWRTNHFNFRFRF